MRLIRTRISEGGYQNQFQRQLEHDEVVAIWRQWMFNFGFELATAQALREKRIYVPTYLSFGSEHVPVSLFRVLGNYHLFAQHRAHSYFLSRGGSPESLRDELLGLSSGCTGGRGGSASIHSPDAQMWGHSGLMGDQVPIAVGYCQASGNKTLAVMGDASAEEDYALAALGYAATKKLPILFLCEDNDFSILTPVQTRRSWDLTTVARAFGLSAFDICDDPSEIIGAAETLSNQLPALINVHIARGGWHAGAGSDGPPEWNRMSIFEDEYSGVVGRETLQKIRTEEVERARRIWEQS